MARAEFDLQTTTSPGMIRTALLDFSERRPDLWPDLHPKYYEVYSVGETTADVKEGSGPPFNVWAREAYDWSDPNTVKWEATESNFCARGSGVTMTVTGADGGGSKVHVIWQRQPTSLKGKLLIPLAGAGNGRLIRSTIQKSLDALPDRMRS